MTVRVFGRSGQRNEPMEPGESEAPRGSHFSLRTGLIALYAVVIAVLAGTLTFIGDRRPAASVAAGGVAFVSAFMFFDKIIGD
ncbi:hypothetical protein NE236_21005 [Actinoallomurus purpureus]|uniref:hypothetical protein n=1 Tax=Actinoallomurus purpureus TaxID=478114 RepID=UPI0020932EDB|nr:hypothetical protein [Actinoallomurus purpureus]MCO6007460.1 hypothetical protein [Actinoallomurus purpureus]